MKVPTGQSWLLLELVTPANFGSGEGRADVDRPTVKDPQRNLPYVPHSVIKGVIAGRHGDIDEVEAERSRTREERYGSPDRPDRLGEAGPVVFGDGELLSYLLPGRDGGEVRVFPAPVVAQCLAGSPASESRAAALELLDLVERLARAGASEPVAGDSGSETARSPRSWTWLDDGKVQNLWQHLRGEIRRWIGPGSKGTEPWLVASGRGAATGWTMAHEERTATAIDPERHTVADGSLRSIELCPAGTVFVSRLSVARPGLDLDFPELLQIGAREAEGFGFCRVALGGETAGPGSRAEIAVASTPARSSRSAARVMAEMHQRLLSAKDEPAPVRGAIRAVITHFGGRAHFQGLRNAVSFSLAKAKPGSSAASPEPLAHRWFLEALLEPEPSLAIWAREPGVLETLDPQREALFERWLWLRRYAELLLGKDEGGAAVPAQGVDGNGDA